MSLLRLLVSVILQVTCTGILTNAVTVTEAPAPQNVSVDKTVYFTCATTNSQDIIAWNTFPNINTTTTAVQTLPGGGTRSTLSFTALLEQSNTIVRCIVTDTITAASTIHSALLLVQGLLPSVGYLTSTEVDHCTLLLTWTAPYTLQGVPINYYTINITRHSDGAVLRTDTTNTTEYRYSVSSLGEMVKTEVEPVNNAGIGDSTYVMMQTPSSISAIKFSSSLMNTTRNDDARTEWIFDFHFEETSVCRNAISHTTVRACMNSSCSDVTNDTMDTLSDSKGRVMATFANLTENRKYYMAVLKINYYGGVVQQSLPVHNLSTFDVRHATYTVENGRVCFDVTYVEGHVKPARSFVQSSTNRSIVHMGMIDQTDNCIELAPNLSYTIKITDEDAKNEIDIVAPVTIIGLSVPEYIISSTRTTLSSSNTVSPSPPSNDDDTIKIVIILLAVIFGLITAIISSVMLCLYLHHKKLKAKQWKDQPSVQHHLQIISENGQQELVESTDVVYADVEKRFGVAPHPALPIGSVEYDEVLMSKGQRQCIERLAKMETLLLTYIKLYELLQPLSLQWRQFGEALCLAPNLDDIEKRNSSDEECLRAVLKCWEETHVRLIPYTWKTLDTVLRSKEIGATHLANELKKRISTESVH